jgi:hypothetical protein
LIRPAVIRPTDEPDVDDSRHPPTLDYLSPRRAEAAAPEPAPGERVAYARGGVLVTDCRLVVGTKTYAMAHVTSVEIDAAASSSGGVGEAVLVVISAGIAAFGIIMAVGAAVGEEPLLSVMGGVVAFVGIALLWSSFSSKGDAPQRCRLWVETPAGRSQVMTGEAATVREVAEAVNRAIIARFGVVAPPRPVTGVAGPVAAAEGDDVVLSARDDVPNQT